MIVEEARLAAARHPQTPWRKWGPYLSERQWGTVREDYSDNGDAWGYFTHDQARSRAYRWGEDGLAGISDDRQRLCFAVALWNERDSMLKERLFGLTNSEGYHGEDAKEYYFYLDNTPTHSYMKYLYKYPQGEFPYRDLRETNLRRTRDELEYELLETGVFDDDRYFDLFVEYAKEAPEEILIQLTIWNRSREEAVLHVLPTLWFRNTWAWQEMSPRPVLRQIDGLVNASVIEATQAELGTRYLYCEGPVPLLFTENETNIKRIFGAPNTSEYVKDGINDFIVYGHGEAVNPHLTGTKAAAHYRLAIAPEAASVIRLRLTEKAPAMAERKATFGKRFATVFAKRLSEAEEFYESITPPSVGEDERMVMRQALAGMLWTKQYYYFDLDRWLEEHGANPLQARRRSAPRNSEWVHMLNDDIISMPDKWEYPWYAAWDLAFHTIPLAMVDLDFAKQQLELMLEDLYLHPSGQLPAYEWNFSDVNPPVHAWATLFMYNMERDRYGRGDLNFLKSAFSKLMLNFTWWVNRKDPTGRNAFQGGFLGLDNIGVFDRSAPLPTGGALEQADGTAWMALYCQNMFEISLELAMHDRSYEDLATKFGQHFFWIAAAMDRIGEHQDEMWDEDDGFFYDLLRLREGKAMRLKVRSMVGLLPLCATTVLDLEKVSRFPQLMETGRKFMARHPELFANIAPPDRPGVQGRRLFSVLNERKLRRVLARMLDEKEFLSPFGIRSLSKYHEKHPYLFRLHGEEFRVAYQPAESTSGLFGGNSNWRGPVWFPVNLLIIRALLQYYLYFGDDFRIECPTGSGQEMTLFEVGREISTRLIRTFLRDENGLRPVFGGANKFQEDPHWRDHLLFYEYFHGDIGAGIGASHQTGWTGVVARLIQMFNSVEAADMLSGGTRPAIHVYRRS
jgi:hypothetical protein